MPVWRPHPAFGVLPRTSCPSAHDTAVFDTFVEYGLTLIAVMILLVCGDTTWTALLVSLTALAGVRAARTVRVSTMSECLRRLLGSPTPLVWPPVTDQYNGR